MRRRADEPAASSMPTMPDGYPGDYDPAEYEEELTISERWTRDNRPDVWRARHTAHPFLHMARDPSDRCAPDGDPRCICAACWEPKSHKVHKVGLMHVGGAFHR